MSQVHRNGPPTSLHFPQFQCLQQLGQGTDYRTNLTETILKDQLYVRVPTETGKWPWNNHIEYEKITKSPGIML